MHTSPSALSLTDRIKGAVSPQEIDRLLAEGEGYEGASDPTRKRWRRKAKQRRTQLEENR